MVKLKTTQICSFLELLYAFTKYYLPRILDTIPTYIIFQLVAPEIQALCNKLPTYFMIFHVPPFFSQRSIQISFQQQHWIKKLKQVMWCGRALLWMMNNFINERGISSFWRVQPTYLRPSPSRCSIWKPASTSATRLLTLDICKWYNISTIILHCSPTDSDFRQ